MNRVMLTENEVNVAVKAFLESHGWVRVVALSGREHGVDVEGDHPDGKRKVQVESKGGTSGDSTTSRHGAAFSGSQIRSHIGKALLTVMHLRDRSAANTVLLALPDDDAHLLHIRHVAESLKKLEIGVLAISRSDVRVVQGSADAVSG